MRIKTLEQITAQEFAGLQIDTDQKLRKGNMSFQQLRWFVNLSFDQRESLLNGNKAVASISEQFEPTEFIVSTTPSGNTYTIGTDRKKLIATKAEGGLFDYVDGDIAGWFPEVEFIDTESVSGRVQLFKNNIMHRDIIARGENLGIYQEYELGSALLLANQLVTAGAIEKKGYGVIIHLKNRKGDNRYHLFVWRDDDGKLRVYVYKVDLDYEYNAGHGVLFSN